MVTSLHRPRCRLFVRGVDKMPSRGREISYELRCCIVCLHIVLPPRNTFNRIGALLDLAPGTCQRIWQRARTRAGCDDFKEVLACVGSLDRSGRPPRVQDGTEESAALRALILRLDEYQLKEVAQIWKEQTGQALARSVVERVAHEHRDSTHNYDIVRGVRPLIPTLTIMHFDDRDIFCQWAIIRVQHGAIFIFTDESSIEVGGPPRSKPKISRPKGQIDTFKRALPVQKVRFKMMIWGAVCAEWKGEFPSFVWNEEIEDDDARRANAYELAQENSYRKAKIEEARQEADSHPLSLGGRALREINSNIQRENARRSDIGQRGRLHNKTSAHIYPYEELKRDYKKNGIDWFLYRQKVYPWVSCFVQL